MVKPRLVSLALASPLGATLAFRPAAPSAVPRGPRPAAATAGDAAADSPPEARGRRAFLARGLAAAAASASPLLLPAAAQARGYDASGGLAYGDDAIMAPKAHGTTDAPVQEGLRYGVSRKLADKISSYNRVFAESGGYFEGSTTFERDLRRAVAENAGGPVTFYDSVSGRPLFRAPVGRSVDDFLAESKVHGWPSFRDAEVVWDDVRVLRSSGETVSVGGTHLGHNLPDGRGNRYCINLVSIAGNPV